MGQFLKDHFDKLLLAMFLILFFMAAGTLVLIFRSTPDLAAKFLDWMTREFDIFAGALIGLITGAAAGVAIGMKMAQPAAPVPPPQTPTA